MRTLIILGLIYLGYRTLKSAILQRGSSRESVEKQTAGAIDDVMVKDPFCSVYFPKRNGVNLRVAGESLSFCSTDCRDKYIAQNKT